MYSETKWNILYDIFKFSSCMGFMIIIFTWYITYVYIALSIAYIWYFWFVNVLMGFTFHKVFTIFVVCVLLLLIRAYILLYKSGGISMESGPLTFFVFLICTLYTRPEVLQKKKEDAPWSLELTPTLSATFFLRFHLS
jgi:hypothetical protein